LQQHLPDCVFGGHATDDERVKATMRGIRRTIGTVKKAAATAERVIAMACVPGNNMASLRDRALPMLVRSHV